MKVDPVTFMLSVLNADVMEVVRTDKDGRVVLDENGQPIRDRIAVPMDMRMDAAKAVAPYVHPRLQAQTLTGPGDGPVQVTNIPVSEILKDPKMAGALSDLALLIAEADDDEASDD